MEEIIYKIKKLRSPEAFLIKIIEGMTMLKNATYNGRDVFLYEYNGDIMFDVCEEGKTIYINERLMWDVFAEKYGLSYYEIKSTIKKVVENHMNLNDYNPLCGNYFDMNEYYDMIKRFP